MSLATTKHIMNILSDLILPIIELEGSVYKSFKNFTMDIYHCKNEAIKWDGLIRGSGWGIMISE